MNPATILTTLDGIVSERGARLLHAVESGSRAWGFASPDSDFDVRFLYVHPRDWYLRVTPGKDSIDRMLPGDLDLSGWELRKALGLLAKSNVALFEHLGSELVYYDGGLGRELRTLIPTFFNPIAAGHHYLGVARTTLSEHFAGDATTIKKLFYVLRPLIAVQWIHEHHTMPPTTFHDVLAGVSLEATERSWIDGWLEAKRDAKEADAAGLEPAARRWLDELLEQSEARALALPHRSPVDARALDYVLRRYVP